MCVKGQEYYDGTEFLKSKDLYGLKPEIFISQSLRSFGKTTFYHNKCVDDWEKDGHQFALLYRNINEVKGASQRLTSILEGFRKGVKFSEALLAGGAISEIYDKSDKLCGYAFALSGYEKVKKNSNVFKDVSQILFDEFLNEDNHYLTNEVNKLISIHTSVARAPHQPVRYVPVYMVSNKINIMNPYFISLNIIQRLQPRTKKLRGDGWVLEILRNKELQDKLKTSAFNRAFAKEAYMGYITDENNKYVNEMVDVGKLKGDKQYVVTFVQNNDKFGCWHSNGLYYFSHSIQPSFKRIIGVELSDRILTPMTDIDYKMLIMRFKLAFEKGKVRFEDGLCKQMFINYLLKI